MDSMDATVMLATGREMPVMGLGTWQLTRGTGGVVADAIRTGYRMIDTSGDDGTEPGVGEGRGVVIQAYSPLTRAERSRDQVLAEVAASHGKRPAQVVLRWQIQLGVVPPPKANDLDHLHQNADVFDFTLAEAEMERIGGLNEHYSALGALHDV